MHIASREYEPIATLQSYVQSFWTGTFNLSGATDFSQEVIPNGSIELIIHLSDTHCILSHQGETWSASPNFTVLGVYPATYQVRFADTVDVFGIRFYPEGLHHIFGLPPAKVLNTYEDGVDVFGNSFKDFCMVLRETEPVEKQKHLAESYLIRNLAKNTRDRDNAARAMRLIRGTNGLAPYRTITDQIPISRRQLQREFKSKYGITLREYMRIMRINAIHKYMLSKPASLTELAYEMDFADQSHFIKEYKTFIGIPPGQFLKDKEDYIINLV